MDARLTEEQELICSTAEQLARDLAPESGDHLPVDKNDQGWRRLAELGLLGMRLPEAVGGSPTSGVELALVCGELGRFLVPLPFLGSAICASEMLVRAGANHELLERLASGDLRLAPVLDPSLTRWASRGQTGIAWESDGAAAGLCLDRDSGRLAAVALGDPLTSQDLTRGLSAVTADAPQIDLGDLGGPIEPDAQTRVLALALAALSADLVGVMQGALERAVEYIKEREQFGVKVGSFQALQHIAAESLASVEGARGCTWYGAWAVDALDPQEALLAARTAKATAAERAREVCEAGIQLHGGIGMTWEHLSHVSLRRALLGRRTLGDESLQLLAISEARHGPPPLH